MVCLPSLLSRPPAMSPDLRFEVNILDEPRILSDCMEWRRDPSTQVPSDSHQCVVEWHEYTIRTFWNSCNTGTSSCCCLRKCVEANPCPRIFALRTSEMISPVLDPWNSNEKVSFSFILVIMTDQF